MDAREAAIMTAVVLTILVVNKQGSVRKYEWARC
jgi:hypothetical protein